jgi:hypothetical protein
MNSPHGSVCPFCMKCTVLTCRIQMLIRLNDFEGAEREMNTLRKISTEKSQYVDIELIPLLNEARKPKKSVPMVVNEFVNTSPVEASLNTFGKWTQTYKTQVYIGIVMFLLSILIILFPSLKFTIGRYILDIVHMANPF